MDFVGIDKMSLVDFDDYLSITLFTEGCNFRCPFCHNGSLVLNKHNPIIPWDEIKTLLMDRKGKIDAVVITGGEPLIHPDIVDKIKEIKEMGYRIKLDTNGTNPKLMIKLIEDKLIDYVAIDIKNSVNKYPLTSGSPNINMASILSSIQYLINHKFPHEFRTTLIKEFHTLDDMIGIANLIKGCQKYVLQHYKDREECIEHGFHDINEEEIKPYIKKAQELLPGTLVTTRGY
ncbi:MAG: anaerobic ribonucleoside-triphosphate reductase activating protein [Bacilli bacterium]|nr:anaerobic ribonucleoside-triphosphate reductase activating protein [Bacilli bacterium]